MLLTKHLIPFVPNSFPQCCTIQIYISSTRGGKLEHVNVRAVEHIKLSDFFFYEMCPTIPPSRLEDFSLFKENYHFIVTILTVLWLISMKKSLMQFGVDCIVLCLGIIFYYYYMVKNIGYTLFWNSFYEASDRYLNAMWCFLFLLGTLKV